MVAAGAEHTAAITEDGSLYGWGWGRYGNLGLGDRNDRLVPEKVSTFDVKNLVLSVPPFAYINDTLNQDHSCRSYNKMHLLNEMTNPVNQLYSNDPKRAIKFY